MRTSCASSQAYRVSPLTPVTGRFAACTRFGWRTLRSHVWRIPSRRRSRRRRRWLDLIDALRQPHARLGVRGDLAAPGEHRRDERIRLASDISPEHGKSNGIGDEAYRGQDREEGFVRKAPRE